MIIDEIHNIRCADELKRSIADRACARLLPPAIAAAYLRATSTTLRHGHWQIESASSTRA
eukprot:2274179-Pleurochrysis_carterae.AAC.1